MEPSISSLAYKGTIPEAILESQRQKKLFVVYVSGLDDESSQLERNTWTDSKVAETVSKYCVLLHIQGGTADAVNFSAIYPQNSVPSITAVGFNGVQVWQSEGFVDAEYLASGIEKAWLSLHIRETTASVLTAALSSRAPDGGQLERRECPGMVVPSSSSNMDRASLLAGQLAASEKIEGVNGHELKDETDTELGDKIGTKAEEVQNVGDEQSTCQEDGSPAKDDSPAHHSGVSGGELESVTSGINEDVQDRKVKRIDHQKGDNLDNEKGVDATSHEEHSVVSGSEMESFTAETNEAVQDGKAKFVDDQKGDNPDTDKGNSALSHVSLNIRLPNGVSLQEKFSVTNTLGMVKDYVDSKSGVIGSYDLAIPYPRKVFHDQELSKSLSELNLLNRQALIVVPHQKASNYNRGGTSSEWATSISSELSNANGGGYFGYVKRIISYINPLSYLGGNASSSSSGQAESGTGEYSPNSALRNNIRGTERSSSDSRNDGQRRTPTTSQFGSNIHTLKHDDDDSQFSGRNPFWNGNSTQYGGDSDAR